MPKTTTHEALIYLMVVTSASDREMTDVELAHIGDSVRSWPIFLDFDPDELVHAARDCQKLLQEEGGLDKVFGIVLESVPLHLHDTAYAAAVEVAVVDAVAGRVNDTLELELARVGVLFIDCLQRSTSE